MDTGVGFINLDDSVKIALNIALAVARENANECYTPSHLLKALLHKDVGLRDFIISIGKDLEIHPVVRDQAIGADRLRFPSRR